MYNYKPSGNCLTIAKHYEECATMLPDGRIQSYWDELGKIWTIGWGSTFYANGTPVKEGDIITQAEADNLLTILMTGFGNQVNQWIANTLNVTQQQFDGVTELAYNVGPTNVKNSTLLKKMLADPADPRIVDEFHRWDIANGKVNYGLLARRHSDAFLYVYGTVRIFTAAEVTPTI